jgi:hypothetical protein
MGMIFATDEELAILHRLLHEEITNVSYWAALPVEERRGAPALKRQLEELQVKIDFELNRVQRSAAVRAEQDRQILDIEE